MSCNIKLSMQRVCYNFALISLFVVHAVSLVSKESPHNSARTLLLSVKKTKTPFQALLQNPFLGVLPIHIDTDADTVFVLLGNDNPPTPWSECSKRSDVNENSLTETAIENGARQLCAYFQEDHFQDYAFKTKKSALKHSIKYLKSLPCHGPFFQKHQASYDNAILLVEVPPVTSSEITDGPCQEESTKKNFKWFDFEALLESTKTNSFTKEYGLRYPLAPHFVQLMRSNYESLKGLIEKLKKQKATSTGVLLAKCLSYLEDPLHDLTTI